MKIHSCYIATIGKIKKARTLPQSVNQKQAIASGSGVSETKTQTKSLSKRWKCCHTTKSERRMGMRVNNLSREGLDTQGYIHCFLWQDLNVWSVWNSAPRNFQGQTPLNMPLSPARGTKGNMWPRVATHYEKEKQIFDVCSLFPLL